MLQGGNFYGELMVNPYGCTTGLPVVPGGCQMPVPLPEPPGNLYIMQ